MMKRLFIPLKREYFEAFEKGTKREEYRPLGPRWNAQTCFIGRRVVLSCGYGKQRRLDAVVTSFRVETQPVNLPGWVECYGWRRRGAACIGITLENTTEATLAVQPPDSWGHKLWQHLHREHGLTLVESELAEIVRLAAPLVLDADTVAVVRMPVPVKDLAGMEAVTRSAYGRNLSCTEKQKGWLYFSRQKEGRA